MQYGGQLVPLDSELERMLSYKPGAGMWLLGFVDKAMVPRHHYMKVHGQGVCGVGSCSPGTRAAPCGCCGHLWSVWAGSVAMAGWHRSLLPRSSPLPCGELSDPSAAATAAGYYVLVFATGCACTCGRPTPLRQDHLHASAPTPCDLPLYLASLPQDVWAVVAGGTAKDNRSSVALSALVQALHRRQQLAIIRFAPRENFVRPCGGLGGGWVGVS